MIKFTFDYKEYEVHKTKHLMESRENARIERSRFMSDRLLKEVLIFSFSRGLTSFRDRGAVCLSFFNDRKIQTSILLELKNNTITIISIYYEKKPSYLKDNFIKTRNRIYLDKVFESLTTAEVKENRKAKSMYEIEKICAAEDSIFERYMKKVPK